MSGLSSPQGLLPRAEILHDEPGFAVATIGDVVIAATRAPPDVNVIRTFVEAIRGVQSAAGGKVSLVLVPNAPRPRIDPEVREALQQQWGNVEEDIRCVAIWIRRTGFWGAALRSIVTTALSLSRGPAPRKVVSSAAQVADWIATHDRSHAGNVRALTTLLARTGDDLVGPD